jgi:hypothetical protein
MPPLSTANMEKYARQYDEPSMGQDPRDDPEEEPADPERTSDDQPSDDDDKDGENEDLDEE